jgi:damage-control phosphatase, subfamily III
LSTFFSLSTTWRSYDVFARQKISTFRSSRPAVLELAARYKEIIQQLSQQTSEKNEEAEKLLFIEMCEICLWGNATDLSLLTSLSYEDIQKLQGSKARKDSEKNIIVNDLEVAYKALKSAKGQDRRVNIVLDNAGFELYVDLILAGYLIAAGLANTVVLHPKSIPWFVSDVVPADFATLLNALADPQTFYSTPSEDEKFVNTIPTPLSETEVDVLSFLFQQWSGLHQEGQLVLRPNRFWTEGGSYWRLPVSDTRLLEDLKSSELVIFKGDLNYRKLTGDVSLLLHS